jgi:NADH:ubiquinone oxidoreductase subunit H
MEIIIYFFLNLLFFILTLVPILIAVAFTILSERKVMASVQRRKGPNVVGFYGLLQPIVDAVKLLTKEIILPSRSNKFLFFMGPILTLTISLIS